MIDQKFDVVFQISQPPNIPKKCFCAQNGHDMRQTPTMEASDNREIRKKT